LPTGVLKDIVTTADTSKLPQGVNTGGDPSIFKRFSYRQR